MTLWNQLLAKQRIIIIIIIIIIIQYNIVWIMWFFVIN